MTTYRIRHLMLPLDDSRTPPAFLPVMFPNFNGERVWWGDGPAGKECFVEFESPQKPVNSDPMVSIQEITS